MGGTHVIATCALILACSCGTGDTRVDPGDLELRDLLGVSPEAAGRWDGEQRESARHVFIDALDDSGDALLVELLAADTVDTAGTVDMRVARSLASLDAQRFAAGDGAFGFVRVAIARDELAGVTRSAPTLRAFADGKAAAPTIDLELTETWRGLPTLSHQLLAALARDAGAADGARVVVVPAPRLTVIASYVDGAPARMLVNPVLLAALDPGATELTTVAVVKSGISRSDGKTGDDSRSPERTAIAAGNPYSFYGSVAECAYAQRSRCTACVTAGDCVPVTSTNDGEAECNALDANGGRGYFLLCINLSLAITSVDECTAELRPGCPRDTDAASDLGQLENNAAYLDDSACGTGLDACLAKIYGAPKNPFPGVLDGGVEPVDPPRDIDVSCGDSCDSDNNSNCEFSPSCNCEGPSCGNSLSCDSTCSSSNNQSGCGDNCDSCSSDSGGGGGGGGGCSSDSGSTSGGCGGGNYGGCGDTNCGSSSSGSSGSGCQVVKQAPSPVFAVALSLSWALLPVPLAAWLRRRKRKGKGRGATAPGGDEEVAS